MQNLENTETFSNRNHLVQLGLSNILGFGVKNRESEPKIQILTKTPAQEASQPESSKKFSKRDYNKAYYQQRKLLKNQTTSSSSVTSEAPLPDLELTPSSPKKSQKQIEWRKFGLAAEIVALLILVAFMTVLLIRESAHFYLDSLESPWLAYLKAGMIEALAILFSFSRSQCKALRWVQLGLVVMICVFTLSLMSGKAVKTASTDTLKVETVKKNIDQLESELAQKEKLRNEFLNRGMLSMTRRYERAVDQTRNKLTVIRNELCSLQSPVVIAQNLRVLIAFRILLVIANLVAIHRMVELFKSSFQLNNERKVKKMTKKVSEPV